MTDPITGVAYAQLTHPGLLRKTNEDCCGASLEYGVFVVCDGMGGAAAGEVASHLTVKTFLERMEQTAAAGQEEPAGKAKDRLDAAIRSANRAVFRRAGETPSLSGMGTTLVAALVAPPGPAGKLWIAHVGDSRAYLFRDGHLRLVTTDHSMVEQQVRAGLLSRADAEVSPVRHVITRAIGSHATVEPEIQQIDTVPGDLLLLASDGLSRELTDRDVRRILAEAHAQGPHTPLHPACQALVECANAHGGRDNVTVLLLRVGRTAAPATLPPA